MKTRQQKVAGIAAAAMALSIGGGIAVAHAVGNGSPVAPFVLAPTPAVSLPNNGPDTPGQPDPPELGDGPDTAGE